MMGSLSLGYIGLASRGPSMRTMEWEYVERLRLMVCVQSEAKMSDTDWDAYTGELHALYAAGRLCRIFVFGDGDGPNARQRKKLHHRGLYENHPINTAVTTHSLIARGVVTAISWFTDIRAFSPEEIDAAFRYLTIPEADWLATRRTIAKFRVQLNAPAHTIVPLDLTNTIGQLDELLTDRLPKLRERIERTRVQRSAGTLPPRAR
jgi:hypothetical protein